MEGRSMRQIPLAEGRDCLRRAEIRPTRQRMGLAGLLATKGERHVTADMLHREAMDAGMGVSLATIYNTLHEFTEAGLLRKVPVGERAFFCTNVAPHHHFYDEDTGELHDIPPERQLLAELPAPPEGMAIVGVDVVVRVRRKG